MKFGCLIIMLCTSKTWCCTTKKILRLFVNSIKHWIAVRISRFTCRIIRNVTAFHYKSRSPRGCYWTLLYARGKKKKKRKIWDSKFLRVCEVFVCLVSTRVLILHVFLTPVPLRMGIVLHHWSLIKLQQRLFCFVLFMDPEFDTLLRSVLLHFLILFWEVEIS